MTDERKHSSERPPDDEARIADDRFIHGVLGVFHQETPELQNARIGQVMDDIADRRAAPPMLRIARRVAPLAAAAALGLAALVFFVSTPPPAYAVVDSAIEATRAATALRYEIRVGPEGDERTIGTMDMSSDLLRIELLTPEGHTFVMGRDDQGDWSLRRDGSVSRGEVRRGGPRWIDLGESTILVGSLDAMLDNLRDRYDIGTPRSEDSGLRITATLAEGNTEPGPDRIEMWIDDVGSLVERLELHWPEPPRREGALPRPGQSGQLPPERTPRASRPEGAPQRDRTGGRPGDPERRPLPPDRRAGERPPRGGIGGGPPPRGAGRPGELGGLGGPPPSRLIDGRPGFRDGTHAPPPKRITFIRVPAPDLGDGWALPTGGS